LEPPKLLHGQIAKDESLRAMFRMKHGPEVSQYIAARQAHDIGGKTLTPAQIKENNNLQRSSGIR